LQPPTIHRNFIHLTAMKIWFIPSSQSKEYSVGLDDNVTYDGKKAAFLRSDVDKPSGFGTLMQNFKSNRYRGKRVRFSGAVKSENITSWAGLWMRVDGNKGETLTFDNMEKRSIKGTTEWERYHVVLDVPEESTGVFFGILLDGTGQVWLSDVQFEEAPNEPTTDITEREEPGNLDFSET